MRTIITPALFLVAAICAAGCTDDDAPVPDDIETEPVASCASDIGPDQPASDRLDFPRQARERLDFLRRLRRHQR
jgi:hypothetical protein